MINNKKNIFYWCLYDFGNSAFFTLVVTFVYATYFTQVISPDEITGTLFWSRGISISAILIAILSPLLGVIVDQGGLKKKMLIYTAVAGFLSTVLLFFPSEGMVFEALFFFIIANVAFELGQVFYNAYLIDITSMDRVGKISGYGWSAGFMGGLVVMFIAMIGFVEAETPWFGFSKNGENIRATNLLVAFWFLIFSCPLILSMKDESVKFNKNLFKLFNDSFNQLKITYRDLNNYREISKFLIARLFYNDGLVTIFAFGAIYASGTFNFSFSEIMLFGIVLNITAGIGSLVFGPIDDKIGGKKTILISLIGLIFGTILAISAQNKNMFWIAGILVGIFSGPNQASSRSLMARIVPKKYSNEFFGFYTFSGKFTSFLGPFLLGIITKTFDSQRAGIFIVLFFFITGLFCLLTVDVNKAILMKNK